MRESVSVYVCVYVDRCSVRDSDDDPYLWAGLVRIDICSSQGGLVSVTQGRKTSTAVDGVLSNDRIGPSVEGIRRCEFRGATN